jgi:hypothetical protein
MPLSFTSKHTVTQPSPEAAADVRNLTIPVCVNLTAFASRFRSACRSRVGSPMSFPPIDGSV